MCVHAQYLLKQLRSPFHRIVQIVTLYCVLKLSIALAPSDSKVLASLQKNGCSRNRRQLGPQTVDDVARTYLSLFQRLQPDVDESPVGGAPASCKRNDIGDSRVLLDHVDERFDVLLHCLIRDILRSLQASEDGAVILEREETLRDNNQEVDVDTDRDEKDERGKRRVPQNNG